MTGTGRPRPNSPGFRTSFWTAGEGDSILDELGKLQEELASAQQGVLYAQAETQNVRRRLEKDIADTRAYAVTGFAREIPLGRRQSRARAPTRFTPEMREDDKLKSFIAGIEATQREIDKVFAPTASAASPRPACRSIRTSTRRCSKCRAPM